MWHMIVSLGSSDQFAPSLGPSDPRVIIAIDHPTSPWYVGNDIERVIAGALKSDLNSVVGDLVRLAVAVYSADQRVPRKRTDDRWTREMMLYMPVSDLALWNGARNILLKLLNFLTGDRWDVQFREVNHAKTNNQESPEPIDAVCLFSGGLDSLVGAIDLLAEGKRVALVSHHGLGDGTK